MHSYRASLLVFLSAFCGIISLFGSASPLKLNKLSASSNPLTLRAIAGCAKTTSFTGCKRAPATPTTSNRLRETTRQYSLSDFSIRPPHACLTEPGPRGGVNIIFEVKELPIIRDLIFEGLSSVPESDVLKAFRERRVGISKESIYDPVKARNAMRVIKELLSAAGHPNATVEERSEEVSATSRAITFVVDEGDRVRVVEVHFEGNTNFSDGQLRGAMKYVKEAGLITRFKGTDILDSEKLEYDLRLVDNYMRSKGYLQARHGELSR